MILDSGVHPWLYSKCHHQIIYAKFNFKVFNPPLYERTVWHFSRAISKKPLTYLLNNLDVNEPVSVFSETVMNIRSNFVPNELIGDPPWVNRHIKNFIVA